MSSPCLATNLLGAATLVGDTTSILLGNYAGMGFNDFFWFHGWPGIMFAVEAGTLMTIPVLLWLFRHEREPIAPGPSTEVTDHVPTALLLSGLLMMIEGLTEAGVIEAVAELFVKPGGGSAPLMCVMIVGVSALLRAFIDNILCVATMLPVASSIAARLGVEPHPFDFCLLIGATLGGNITPSVASANITGIGIQGDKVTTKDLIRIGIPFTLIAASVATLAT